MRIKSITLTNYRLYNGANSVFFNEKDGQNIYLISGETGFGKTTFLHSLLWCLYGRLMTDIDEVVRKEIANKGGYNAFLKSNLNIIFRFTCFCRVISGSVNQTDMGKTFVLFIKGYLNGHVRHDILQVKS